MNSVYDPDFTNLTGNSSTPHATMSNFYNYYQVYAVNVEVNMVEGFSSTTTSNSWVVCKVTNTSSP